LCFLELLHVQFTVVLLTSGYVVWFVTLESIYVKDCSKTATVWPGGTFDANVEFPAVCGVSVSAVQTWLVNVRWVRAHKSFSDFELVTPLDEVSPDADPLFCVVSEAWWALVTGGLTVPAGVEHSAVILFGVDTIETGAVGGTYRGLEVGPVSAVDAEGVGAVFSEWVDVIEDQAVAAQLQSGRSVLASPVLVAAPVMWVETEVVWAVEFIPLTGNNSSQSN